MDPDTGLGSTRVRNLRVRMQHTALAASTGLVADGWSMVYAVSSLVPAEGEWRVLRFDQPFVWNGRDHLLVDLTRDDTVNQAGWGDMELRTGLSSRMVVGWGDSVALWPFDAGLATAVVDAIPALRLGWVMP